MLERAPGIFEVELHSNQKSIDEIKIFLIPGKDGERSLMVDAGFRSRTCLHVMEEALGKLGITYDRLDIFLPTNIMTTAVWPASMRPEARGCS